MMDKRVDGWLNGGPVGERNGEAQGECIRGQKIEEWLVLEGCIGRL